MALVEASIDLVAPLPMATTAITQPTPMMMPRAVRKERILLRAMARRPTRMMLLKRITELFIGLPPPEWARPAHRSRRRDRADRRAFAPPSRRAGSRRRAP